MSTKPFYPADEQAPFSMQTMKAVSDILLPGFIPTPFMKQRNTFVQMQLAYRAIQGLAPFQIYTSEVSVLDGRLTA